MPLLEVEALTASCLAVILVAFQAVPLVYACLDGCRVIGCDLDLTSSHRLVMAERISEALDVGKAYVCTDTSQLASTIEKIFQASVAAA